MSPTKRKTVADSVSSSPIKSLNRRISRSIIDYWWHVRLFSRNVRLFLLGSFLIGLTAAAGSLLLNLYLKERGADESFIGTFLSAGALGMAIIAIPAAMALRKIRLKVVLISSTLTYLLSILLLSRLPVSNLLIFFSFVGGLAMTFNRIAGAPFFMRNSTPRERTYIFSFGFGVMLIAGMIGSLASGWMVTLFSKFTSGMVSAYQWTFIVAVALGLLAIIPFSLIRAADLGDDDRRADFSLPLLKKRAKLFARLLVPQFTVGVGAGLIIPFLNLYFRDRFGQTPDRIGFFFFAVNTTMLLGILAGPVLAKKFGMVKTLVATELLSIPFMIVLAYTYMLPLALAAFLIRGALMNMAQPIGTNFGMEIVNKSEHALINALLTLSWTSSWMVSTAVGGHLIEKYGYTLPLLIAAGLYFLSAALYYSFFHDSDIKAGERFITEVSG